MELYFWLASLFEWDIDDDYGTDNDSTESWM
jgi:hypothetical protein